MKRYSFILLFFIVSELKTNITTTVNKCLTAYVIGCLGASLSYCSYKYICTPKPLTKNQIEEAIKILEFNEIVLFFLDAVSTIITSGDVTEALEKSVQTFTKSIIEDIDNRMPYHTVYEPHLIALIKEYKELLNQIEKIQSKVTTTEKKELKKKKYFLQNDYIKLRGLYALLTSSELYHREKRAYFLN